jgi:preprotein translocase subunit SecE
MPRAVGKRRSWPSMASALIVVVIVVIVVLVATNIIAC